ncbi:lipid kinase [Hydrococcus rivularis NIES-593]|uniref:Lipid kinase n=1 Tax=Hydrococcus rivularis NIES-593 TaxID=1921803 RepID=A0A1U7HRL8_9CYAN|nr:YegS/Rv2252/BmrU family lipid kinase [Hydrococcus rivularis]OKH26175.1 lipid kinase [Hydrococcus rivularis NIES-593]
MTRKACLIFNPVAGQSDPNQDLETIKVLLSPEFDLDIQITSQEVDADELAQKAVERGVEVIIAAGGDGTLSAAAAATVGTDIPLGAISRGTANAFAAALNLPSTIEAACRAILTGKTKKVDAAICNGKAMVLLAGVGFEAETVENTSRQLKNRWGMLAYVMAGVQQLSQLEAFEVEIETDDKIIRSPAVNAVTVANAAPPTSILAQGPAGIIYDDGLLDVTIVAVEKWTDAIATSYHLLQTGRSGDAASLDKIGYLRTKRVKITTQPPQKVVLDGEIIGTTPIEVECVPDGLTICIPETLAEEPSEKLEGLPGVEVEMKSDT